jgi:Photosynthesis system II assembly factor YCF48/Putative zinc-finger
MQDLPKIVRDRLQQPAGAESHPDADLLTAFVERSLVDSERSRVLAHLARCANCREIVTLALPATEAVALPLSVATPRNHWFNLPALRWGVVAAGILAVASIGIVEYRRREPQPKIETKIETVAPALTARNDTVAREQVQPSPGSLNPGFFNNEAVDLSTQRKQSEVREKSRPNTRDALSADKAVSSPRTVPRSYAMRSGSSRSGAGGGPGAGFAPALRKKDETTMALAARTSPPRPGPQFVLPRSSQVVEVQTENAAPVSTAQNQVADQLIQSQKELPLQSESVTNSDVVKAKAPTLPEAAPSAASAQTGSSEKSLQPGTSPQRWTISSSGTLQRSFDAGNTWQDVDLNRVADVDASKGNIVSAGEKDKKKVAKEIAQPNSVFRAVTAIGSDVWAGGSGAMLFHSDDFGVHWTRLLPSSASRVLNGDIMVIEFSDAQHGKIATSYGELWVTADNGKTWSLQP